MSMRVDFCWKKIAVALFLNITLDILYCQKYPSTQITNKDPENRTVATANLYKRARSFSASAAIDIWAPDLIINIQKYLYCVRYIGSFTLKKTTRSRVYRFIVLFPHILTGLNNDPVKWFWDNRHYIRKTNIGDRNRGENDMQKKTH